MTPEEILLVACWDIACNQSIQEREHMIDVAANALAAYMKAKNVDSIEVPGRPNTAEKLD